MRNLRNVVRDIIYLIPQERQVFKQDLNSCLRQDISAYTAPEDVGSWDDVCLCLQKHIPNPNESWEFKVLSEFTKKSVYDLKRAF